MKVVLDTNILVSALLSPGRAAWILVAAMRAGALIPLVDARILAEYREVLARAKFGFSIQDVDELLSTLTTLGECIDPKPLDVSLLDRDDLPFLEVAVSGSADALVTGNIRHFPTNLGVSVLTPRELIEWLPAQLRG